MTNQIAEYNKAIGYERVAKLGLGYKANRYGILDKNGVVELVLTLSKLKKFINA